jgi:N-acyl-D-amino-acid deacylase
MSDQDARGITRRGFLKQAAVATVGLSTSMQATGCGRYQITQENTFDVLIQNGSIYDGTLSKPYIADIGIKGDRIIAIGDLGGNAAKLIDAEKKIVSPGFIDVHTHCDLTFKRTGWKRYGAYLMPSWKGNYNYIYQGVTTVITGNCGYGYTDANEWFDIVDSVQFGTNVYQLVPHGMIRKELFGRKQPIILSMNQLEAMKIRVKEEMEKGCVGLSTGLEYAPGFHSTTDELIELARVARKCGGIYTTHVRDESGTIYPNGRIGVIEALKEAIEIGRRAEIPVEVSHLKISAPFENVSANQVLDLIEQARMEGMDITADQYPYDMSSTTLSYLLPNKYKTSEGILEKFKTSEGKKQIHHSISEVFSYLGPEKTYITYFPENGSYEGKTIAEIAEIEGRSPEESYADMVCEDTVPVAVFYAQDMKVVEELMPRDYIITASDGWTVPKGMTKPHPRTYGTFPKKLKKFVIDKKMMDLGTVLRSMTSLPAEKFKLESRGKIAENYYADIAVIDLKTVTDHATVTAPHQYAEGITHILVNGEVALEDGIATGVRGGRALRKV